jgi:branched-chain amino acid transport system substrate-binding protein
MKPLLASIVALLLLSSTAVQADPQPMKLGLIASLTGFASPYGTAVREGAELAVSELRSAGVRVDLSVEDDQSDPTKVVTSYRYLQDVKQIQALIGGSWWVRPLVKITEQSSLPFLSCETLYDQDFVAGKSYFILGGKVANWVRVYDSFFRAHGMHRGAAIRFTSGFSATIADEMRQLFSIPGREFAGVFEYQSLAFTEASTIALKLKQSLPDVVYVDGQPEGLATFIKRRAELKIDDITVVGHSALETALQEKLVTPQQARNLYFLRRKPPEAAFARRFQSKFNHPPALNADLGYDAVYLAVEALRSEAPLAALRSGLVVQGRRITFDENQVGKGIEQEIYTVDETGALVKAQ